MKLLVYVTALCLSTVSAQRRVQDIDGVPTGDLEGGEMVSNVEDEEDNVSTLRVDPEYEEYMNSQTELQTLSSSSLAFHAEPTEGSIISIMEFPLLVEVDSSVPQVFFQLDDPNGATSDWMEGEHETGSSTHLVVMSSYLGPGQYTWRFKTVDRSKTEVVSEDTIFYIDQESTPFGMLRSQIAGNIAVDSSLAEGYITLGVHDCADRCDGCVDLVHEDPYGLSSVIDSLQSIWMDAKEMGISRADVFFLASLVGAEMSEANARAQEEFPMEFAGRVNCEKIIPYCVALDGGQIHCGPKAAPDYGDSDGMGSLAVSTLDISTMDAATLSSVQAAGDTHLLNTECSYAGPCLTQPTRN